ncbi:MAG TPA: GspE/PulE family protein [Candidatus Saccharimonadales bacterium]|nr:GspE/PulE family protein [Candidatus Saccharimonadales bacterium]
MRISDSELNNLLTKSGKVKPEALKEAETVHEQTGQPLLQEIIKRKLITEDELHKLYAKSIDVPFIKLKEVKIPRDLLMKIPERIARKYQAVLFGKEGTELQLAMADPEDFQAADFIAKQIGQDIKIFLASGPDIMAVIDQYKGNISSEITKAIKDSSAEEESEQQQVSAKDLAEDAPIAKTVNIVLEYAVKSRASDIHIEPRENLVQVRFRIDGVLREMMTLPKPILPAVVSRIKILSNLKIDEHRVPQDGRFKFSVGSKTVALRVSTLPVMEGEKVVMRILDESARALTLEELGFTGGALDRINRGIKKPHGMVLVTGPTGSGKSTTLYSVLSILNTPGVNISTVEDPVEYRVSGVNQTQVNPKAGMTFASGLRALLRQDPNVIMVGEIRDGETADLAVQAALTGHVVLSTLHTNNAATCLPRLLEMGIEPFLIASTVNTVIGQRLVRKLCQSCRVPYIPEGAALEDIKRDFDVATAMKHLKEIQDSAKKAPEDDKEEAKASGKAKKKVIQPLHEIEAEKSILDKISKDPNIVERSAKDAESAAKTKTIKQEVSIKEPKLRTLKSGEFALYKAGEGCEHCGGGAYQGRMGIYEVLEVAEDIQKMIVSHATSEELQNQAIKNGMLTMQQDGFLKCLEGFTTIEEIMRVTRE